MDELSEIYRIEKKSGSLTNVRPDLYKAIATLMIEQRREYDECLRKDPDSIFSDGANSRRKKGKKLSYDIIEIRMGKICKMALRAAMGESHSIDQMTEEEKAYYERIKTPSKEHRELLDRLSGSIRYTVQKLPVSEPEEIPVPPSPVQEEEYYEPEDIIPVPVAEEEPIPAPVAETVEIPLDVVPEDGEFFMDEPEQIIPDDELDRMIPQEPAAPPAQKEDPDFVLIRILQDIPTFSGPLRDYSLKKEQVVRMPIEIAQALINREFAKKIDYQT